MAIAFARCQPISRGRGGNAVRSAAYAARETLVDERTGTRYAFKDHGTLDYVEVLLPPGNSDLFCDRQHLWAAVELAERRRDACVAYELVLALPNDTEISRDDRIAMAREFVAEHFVSKGVPAQISLHKPHNSTWHDDHHNHHVHVEFGTRKLEHDQFAKKKLTDIIPKFIKSWGKPIVSEAEDWGKTWAIFQDQWFTRHGKAVRVDPIAEHPGIHLGPKRFRHPDDPRIKDQEVLRSLNAAIAKTHQRVTPIRRDDDSPHTSPYDQLPANVGIDERAVFGGRTYDALGEKLDAEHYAAYTGDDAPIKELRARDAAADRVRSGWRPLTIEDVARTLSPAYDKARAALNEARDEASKIQRALRRAEQIHIVGEHRIRERREELGFIRLTLHDSVKWRMRMGPIRLAAIRLARDPELDKWEGQYRGAGKRVVQEKHNLKTAESTVLAAEMKLDRAFAAIEPEARAVLDRRQRIARQARREAIEEVAEDLRQAQSKRQRHRPRAGP